MVIKRYGIKSGVFRRWINLISGYILFLELKRNLLNCCLLYLLWSDCLRKIIHHTRFQEEPALFCKYVGACTHIIQLCHKVHDIAGIIGQGTGERPLPKLLHQCLVTMRTNQLSDHKWVGCTIGPRHLILIVMSTHIYTVFPNHVLLAPILNFIIYYNSVKKNHFHVHHRKAWHFLLLQRLG